MKTFKMLTLAAALSLSFAALAQTGSRSNTTDATPPQPPRATTALIVEDFANVGAATAPGAGGVCPITIPGWFAQNNSVPVGTTCVFQGNTTVFNAQAGAANSYAAFNFNSTGDVGDTNTWLVTPQVQFRNGAELRFWTRIPTGTVFPDRLEIRLSTAGASTNVGTGAAGVGDFTTLLGTINPSLVATVGTCTTPAAAPGTGGFTQAYCEYRLTNANGIPTSGSGRIAFRYNVPNAGASGANSNYVGLDTFSYEDGVQPIAANTLSPWALGALALVLGGLGVVAVRRFS